jgi:hypothetical protein
VKVVSIPFCLPLWFLVCFLGRERESKSCKHLSQTPNKCLYTFARNKACMWSPIFGLKPRNFNALLLYLHEALFDWVLDLVLVYCFFSKLGIIDYLITLVDLTLIILSSEMLKFSQKKKKKTLIKEKLWNKKLNLLFVKMK